MVLTMKPWHLYSSEDDERLYSEPFDLEAALSAPTTIWSPEEPAQILTPPLRESLPCSSEPASPPAQTPQAAEESGQNETMEEELWSAPPTVLGSPEEPALALTPPLREGQTSPEPASPPAQTPQAAEESGQTEDLKEEIRKLKAELQRQVNKNSMLQQKLRSQEKLTRAKATCLDEANVVLQKKEDYISKMLLKNKELNNKLEKEVQKNRRLEETLHTQQKTKNEKSVKLDEAYVLLQKKEDYIYKTLQKNKELSNKLENEVQKTQQLEETVNIQVKINRDRSVQLDELKILLHKKEDFIEKMLMKSKKLSGDLQEEVEKNKRQELTLKDTRRQYETKCAKLDEANTFLQKKENYIEKLLVEQGRLQRQLKNMGTTQRPRYGC